MVLDLPGGRLGIAGTKGFGGGFKGACGSEFGEPEMKAFIAHTRRMADNLASHLDGLDTTSDRRIALLHYAPVEGTLVGERLDTFLGSHLLGDATVDRGGCHAVFHGHAHRGATTSATSSGIPVENVACRRHLPPALSSSSAWCWLCALQRSDKFATVASPPRANAIKWWSSSM